MISPETLRFFPFFAGQSVQMLREIAMISEEREFAADEWLFSQGDPADHFYLVLEGGVSLALILHLNGRGEHVEQLATLGRGEVLGWSALVKPLTYSFGAQATQPTTVMVIEGAELRRLLDDNPEYGFFIMKKLCEVIGERLNYKCIQLLSLVVEPPLPRAVKQRP